MLTNTDLSKLRAIDIEAVAEACGLKVKKHRSLCPWHSDTIPSLTYYRKKNTYKCFVCEAHGDPINMVQHMMNLSFRDACHWLAKTFDIVLEDENHREFQNIQRREVKPARSTSSLSSSLTQVDVRHLSMLMAQPYLCPEAKKFLFDERKIKPEVVSRLGLSSISSPVPMSGDLNGSWFNAPSLLIPYRDIDGNLLSVQARYLGKASTRGGREGVPRFQFPKGSCCTIFNLPILKAMAKGDHLFVTEGVSDCLAMLSAGYPAIAIPSATLLKPDQAKILKDLVLHIYPDRDAPGERLFLDLKDICPDIVRHQLPEGYKDIGQYYASLHRFDSPQNISTLYEH